MSIFHIYSYATCKIACKIISLWNSEQSLKFLIFWEIARACKETIIKLFLALLIMKTGHQNFSIANPLARIDHEPLQMIYPFQSKGNVCHCTIIQSIAKNINFEFVALILCDFLALMTCCISSRGIWYWQKSTDIIFHSCAYDLNMKRDINGYYISNRG